MGEPDDSEALRRDLRTAWHRYVDRLVPERPALHRYCRRLTGSLWDAEDLAQETLLRCFGQWGVTTPEIRNVRAYLLRTATHVWIDQVRRREAASRAPLDGATPAERGDADPSTGAALREAGSRLLQRLSPQEQAAVVLKEVFDMSLEEIAETIATTTGAVKAALHRARERLREPEGGSASRRPAPSAALLDRFIERYRAEDVQGLVSLMLESGSTVNVGNSFHVGTDPKKGFPAFFHAVVHGHKEWPARFQFSGRRVERVELEGEPILLFFVGRDGREALIQVMRFEEEDGRIARIRGYSFCPDTIRAVAEVFGHLAFTGLYRAPTPAPGVDWPEPAA